ncbi:MAG: nicotinamide mononucleotide transporter [Bacteroidales bacterium]|nr:nicotinamide mononucleotide transporter [Bacteroidales bacterium]
MEKSILEIFTLITGVIYVILEIRQKNAMWVLGIITSLASMLVFYSQGLYASFGLNAYYLITAFIGLWQWRKDKGAIENTSKIHLNKLSWNVAGISAVIFIGGSIGLAAGMEYMSDLGFKENPMSLLDASVAVLSAVATWWLVKSYLQQWWLWIAANILSLALCAAQGMWWMAFLYILYATAAVIGLIHWKKNGEYVHCS